MLAHWEPCWRWGCFTHRLFLLHWEVMRYLGGGLEVPSQEGGQMAAGEFHVPGGRLFTGEADSCSTSMRNTSYCHPRFSGSLTLGLSPAETVILFKQECSKCLLIIPHKHLASDSYDLGFYKWNPGVRSKRWPCKARRWVPAFYLLDPF